MKRLLFLILCLASIPASTHVLRADPRPPDNTPGAVKPLPQYVDLRANFAQWGLPIKPQLKRDTCAVFTFSGALEYALGKGTGGRGERLSEEYLNWAANEIADDDEDGASYEDLIAGFDKWGICRDVLMPYQARYTSTQPTRDALASAKEVWGLGFKRHWIARRTVNGLDDSQIAQMKKVLASGYPLCAYGVDHSILLVGYYEDAKDPSESYFITRDSAIKRYETIYFDASKDEFGSVLWIELPKQ
jgi:hypothetical protein